MSSTSLEPPSISSYELPAPLESYDLRELCKLCKGRRYRAWESHTARARALGELLESLKGLGELGSILEASTPRLLEVWESLISYTPASENRLSYMLDFLDGFRGSSESLRRFIAALGDRCNELGLDCRGLLNPRSSSFESLELELYLESLEAHVRKHIKRLEGELYRAYKVDRELGDSLRDLLLHLKAVETLIPALKLALDVLSPYT